MDDPIEGLHLPLVLAKGSRDMNITRIPPPPPQPTFNIEGLTEDQAKTILRSLLSACREGNREAGPLFNSMSAGFGIHKGLL